MTDVKMHLMLSVTGLGMLLLAIGSLASGDDGDRLGSKNQNIAEQRQGQIDNELQSLKGHAWAGDYYSGDGLGVNIDLRLAPKSGFAFTWHGCLGLYDLNYGDVQEEDGKVRLISKLPNERDGFQGIAPEMFPIAWGERHYLVPTDETIDFANEINAGFEPRKALHGRFLLRRGDEQKAAPGKPELPAEYAGYLLSQPIHTQISSIRNTTREKARHVTIVVLDVGSTVGVKKGMEFYVQQPSKVFEWARVTNVGDSSSEAEIIQDDELDRHAKRPAPGWKLSTSPESE